MAAPSPRLAPSPPPPASPRPPGLPRLARLACLAVAFALAAAGAPGASRAEPGRYYQEDPAASVRRGWNAGVGVGGGEISCGGPGCEGVTEAGSLDVQLGLMLRPRLRAVADLWAMAHREEDLAVNQTIATVGLQLWITSRLWVRGGPGLARAGFTYQGELVGAEEDRAQTRFGLAGGIGFELLSRPSFALDLELRGGTGFYQDIRAHNGALTAGLTWY